MTAATRAAIAITTSTIGFAAITTLNAPWTSVHAWTALVIANAAPTNPTTTPIATNTPPFKPSTNPSTFKPTSVTFANTGTKPVANLSVNSPMRPLAMRAFSAFVCVESANAV